MLILQIESPASGEAARPLDHQANTYILPQYVLETGQQGLPKGLAADPTGGRGSLLTWQRGSAARTLFVSNIYNSMSKVSKILQKILEVLVKSFTLINKKTPRGGGFPGGLRCLEGCVTSTLFCGTATKEFAVYYYLGLS
jgi:hypothetical protein